jgi:hypothetical protein
MRALLLNSRIILVIKKVWVEICGLEFLANFILEVAFQPITQELQIKTGKLC